MSTAELVRTMEQTRSPLRSRLPMLVTVLILVHTVQPNWVVETREILTTGHLRFAVLNPGDVALLPFALLAIAGLRKAWRDRPLSLPLWIGAILAVGALISAAVHPSLRGILICYRLVAALGVIWAVSQFTKQELVRNLALPVLVVAGLEGLLAGAQLLTDQALLPEWTGAAGPVTTDGVARAAGTLGHAYEAAAFGLLAVGLGVAVFRTLPFSWRRWWPPLLALAVLPAALSFSRSAALGLLLVGLMLIIGMITESRDWFRVLAAILLGVGITVAVFPGGWGDRVDHSTAGAEGSGTNLRIEQLEQAWSLIETDWLIGVGPGLYSVTLEERVQLDPARAYPVHNVPLYVTAENGAIVGGVLLLLALALAAHALRRSTENRALFVAPLGFVIFDVLLYTAPAGLLMLSLWLGALAALESRREL